MKEINRKTPKMKEIESKLGGDIEEILRILFVDEELPVKIIADKLGTSYVTAHAWIQLAGIRSRRLKVGRN